MRFAILLAAVLLADAIRPGYLPSSKMFTVVFFFFMVAFFYADIIEFYKKVWKR